MAEACSPARNLDTNGLQGIYTGSVENTIKDAFDILGCDCVTSNLLDCVASDMYGCYRDSLLSTDLGCASSIDSDALAHGCSSLDKLSSGSCFSTFSEHDLYPGATSVCVLAEEDFESAALASDGCSLGLLGLPMQQSMQLPEAPVPAPAPEAMRPGLASLAAVQHNGLVQQGLADAWCRRSSDPDSPLSSVASLSAASSMASLSTMVHVGGGVSPRAHSQHQNHTGDMALVAERLGSINPTALPGHVTVMQQLSCHTALLAHQEGAAAGLPAEALAPTDAAGLVPPRRVIVRPRRAASFVPTQLAGRCKKRGSAANNTCKVAPNPNGHSCTACGATSTPVWRAGPCGPKTLCNACGVRYMKVAKNKK